MATNVFFTTAKGEAYYPYISAPDTKFDEQGHYKVNLCLSKEDAKPVIELIKTVIAENKAALEQAGKSKQVSKAAPLPFEAETDEETGELTGNIIIKFKSKAAYKPAVFDAKGQMMPKHNIYGGSKIKVSSKADFYTSPSIGYGVALRLRAVQVLEYVEGSSGGNKFGFGEEDGFTLGEEFETHEEASINIQEEVAVSKPAPAPAPVEEVVEEAPKPAPKKVAEEPKAAPVADSGADDLAAEIASLIGGMADD